MLQLYITNISRAMGGKEKYLGDDVRSHKKNLNFVFFMISVNVYLAIEYQMSLLTNPKTFCGFI